MYNFDNVNAPLTFSSSGSAMGLVALRDELVAQGVDELLLIEGTDIDKSWLKTFSPPLTHDQRIAFIRNAQQLAREPDTALRAGCRQRISDFGMYGYAMISSSTFGEALRFAFKHRELAGVVLRISCEYHKDMVIFKTHHPQTLGPLLPFVTEFWRSTITSLFSHILGRNFVAKAMYFQYPKPSYASAYKDVFQCPIYFSSDKMEWHFDASILEEPCPKANELTANVCANFCENVLQYCDDESQLQKEISIICLGSLDQYPTGDEMAKQLHMSRRTLFRKLKDEGVSYQIVLDNLRKSIAIEYLESTRLSVDEIAVRLGFSDCSNFRKAFKRWTCHTPSQVRRSASNN